MAPTQTLEASPLNYCLHFFIAIHYHHGNTPDTPQYQPRDNDYGDIRMDDKLVFISIIHTIPFQHFFQKYLKSRQKI